MKLTDRFNELDRGMKIVAGIALVAAVGVALVVAVVGVAIGGTFLLSSGESVPAAPAASFSLSQTDGGVQITHQDGDPVAADSLVVAIGSEISTWSDWSDDDALVEPGDSVLVDADAGTTIELQWTDPAGEPVTLVSYTVK